MISDNGCPGSTNFKELMFVVNFIFFFFFCYDWNCLERSQNLTADKTFDMKFHITCHLKLHFHPPKIIPNSIKHTVTVKIFIWKKAEK